MDMTDDRGQASGRRPASHNGHRKLTVETRAFDAKAAFNAHEHGRKPHSRWPDDPAAMADDALMRCYNG
jgi:hypothetical protein